MYKVFIFLCLLIALCFRANAVDQKKQTTVTSIHHSIDVDSSKINIRSFNASSLNKYRNNPEFDYHTDVNKNDSIWDRFWRWLWHIIENLFESSGKSKSAVSPYFKYSLMVILTVLLIYFVLKSLHINNIFSRGSKQIDIPHFEWLENIHEIDFDKEIENAMAQHNYRLAIRLLYLQCLKQLNDKQIINWQIEKPNSVYLKELSNSEQKELFRLLTMQFEYVWYGDFPVDGKLFKNIYSSFQVFKSKIL